MIQVLERDSGTVVLHGLTNDGFGDAVQVVGAPPGESVANRLCREVSRARTCLLEVAAPTFVFVAAMIEGICIAEERSGTGDGHVPIHVQVHTENHSVLGFVVARGGTSFFTAMWR